MMDPIGTITLEGMEFHAFHGCFEQEKRDGNLFTVDFKGRMDLSAASVSDCLEDTLDYGKIHGIISREMAVRSDLLEHVAGRIVRAIEEELPELVWFEVKVSKHTPPVPGKCRWSAITLTGGSGTGTGNPQQ